MIMMTKTTTMTIAVTRTMTNEEDGDHDDDDGGDGDDKEEDDKAITMISITRRRMGSFCILGHWLFFPYFQIRINSRTDW